MRLRIDLKIFLFIIIFYFTKQIYVYASIMIFAIIHELGHLLAGLLVGMKPEKIELMPMGLSISFKIEPKDYNIKIKKGNLLTLKKIFVAFAGPLTNMLVIIISLFMKVNVFAGLIIIYSNILIFLFNLIPIYPLDGGRILKGILHIFKGKRKAEKEINIISYVITIILTAISSILIIYFKNISIFFIIIYLWILVLMENKKYMVKKSMYELIDKE